MSNTSYIFLNITIKITPEIKPPICAAYATPPAEDQDKKEFTNLKINFTGGLYKNDDVGQAFLRGADLVTVSSVAVYDRDLFMSWYLSWGRKKIVLACDVKDNILQVGGWKVTSKVNIFE